jgi:hypothetical protein
MSDIDADIDADTGANTGFIALMEQVDAEVQRRLLARLFPLACVVHAKDSFRNGCTCDFCRAKVVASIRSRYAPLNCEAIDTVRSVRAELVRKAGVGQKT